MNRSVNPRESARHVNRPGAGRGISRRPAWTHLGALVMALPLFLGVVVAGTAAPAAAAGTVKGYTPVNPVRICDTRSTASGVVANQCQGASGAAAPLGAAGVKTVVVAGNNGVPATATAVVVNVTATNVTAVSYFTVFPTSATQPIVSNLNWTPGHIVQNLVTVPLGTGGSISVYNNQGSADLVIDLEGFVDPAAMTPGLFTALTPSRICDTRPTSPGVVANPCQGSGGTAGTMAPNTQKVVTVPVATVPATATAVVLNVTVAGPTAVGFLTVWPDGANKPLASNLNWGPGMTVPNRVIVPLPSSGKIDVYNSAGHTDVIIDVNGYFSPMTGGAGFRFYTPTRICDTRPQGPGVALNGCNNPANGPVGPLQPGDELSLPTQPDAAAVVYNTTVVNTTRDSFLTLFPDPDPTMFTQPPLISDLNWGPGTIIANLVVVGAGPNHAVAIYNKAGNTDVVIDVQADLTTSPTAAAMTANSLLSSVRIIRAKR
jgi:hypothetical protein